MIRHYTKKHMNLQKRNMEPRKESVETRISRIGQLSVEHAENLLKKEGYDIEYQIVALFHDLLEDTDATEDEIRSIAGEEVLQAVKLLTKEKGYDMQTYVTRIRQNPIAYAVKGADRLHNLRTASCTSRHFRQKYITETETWYLSFRPDIPQEVEKLKQTLIDEATDNSFMQVSSE